MLHRGELTYQWMMEISDSWVCMTRLQEELDFVLKIHCNGKKPVKIQVENGIIVSNKVNSNKPGTSLKTQIVHSEVPMSSVLEVYSNLARNPADSEKYEYNNCEIKSVESGLTDSQDSSTPYETLHSHETDTFENTTLYNYQQKLDVQGNDSDCDLNDLDQNFGDCEDRSIGAKDKNDNSTQWNIFNIKLKAELESVTVNDKNKYGGEHEKKKSTEKNKSDEFDHAIAQEEKEETKVKRPKLKIDSKLRNKKTESKITTKTKKGKKKDHKLVPFNLEKNDSKQKKCSKMQSSSEIQTMKLNINKLNSSIFPNCTVQLNWSVFWQNLNISEDGKLNAKCRVCGFCVSSKRKCKSYNLCSEFKIHTLNYHTQEFEELHKYSMEYKNWLSLHPEVLPFLGKTLPQVDDSENLGKDEEGITADDREVDSVTKVVMKKRSCTYCCVLCNDGALLQYKQNSHLKKCHPETQGKDEKVLKNFIVASNVYDLISKNKMKVDFDTGHFICLLCNEQFSQHLSIRQHLIRVHSDAVKTRYECYFCNITYTERADFLYHMLEKHNKTCQSIINCSCGKMFYSKNRLVEHKMEEHEEAFKCPVDNCSTLHYRKLKYFQLHLMKDHFSNLSNSALDDQTAAACNSNGENDKMHEKEVTKTNDDVASSCDEVVHDELCCVCGEVFKLTPSAAKSKWRKWRYSPQTLLAKHIEKHHQDFLQAGEHGFKVFKCSKCPLLFMIESNRDLHVKTNHGHFPCVYEGCNKVYGNQGSLKTHMVRGHRNMTHQCQICGNQLCDANQLRIHIKTVHEKKRDFACQYCNKTFNRKSILTVHTRIHTGEKPHKCDYKDCDFTGRQRNNVIAHMKTFHRHDKLKKVTS